LSKYLLFPLNIFFILLLSFTSCIVLNNNTDKLNVSSPTLSLKEGIYTSSQNLSITCETENAEIYYTTNGDEPDSSSLKFTADITISSSQTLKAKALKKGYKNSLTVTANYTITGTISDPYFDIPSGTYTTGQKISIFCPVIDADIYYTTNGDDPTINSTKFTNPINVQSDSSVTVKAKAFKEGWNSSEITLANYTCNNIASIVSHLVGTTQGGGYVDGTGTAAKFFAPEDIASDGTNLYICDTGNHTIRKIVISTGEVTTIAGKPGYKGSTDGIGSEARFYSPSGLTTDGTNLYIADTLNSTIRKIVIASGEVTTIAGLHQSQGSSDGIGSTARFFRPEGITTDGTNLYIADTLNNTIRKIVIASVEVTTIAGVSGSSGSTDGIGSDARFYSPSGLTTDGTNLYIIDYENDAIRKIVIDTAEVSTITDSDMIPNRRFSGISINGDNLYISSIQYRSIYKLSIVDKSLTTIAGSSSFIEPSGVVLCGTSLYVCDRESHTIRKIDLNDNNVTTFSGSYARSEFNIDQNYEELHLYPRGVTLLGTDLYIANGNTIKKVDILTGVITNVAGNDEYGSSSDGTGQFASFGEAKRITNDGVNLYVCDEYYNTIRKVVIETAEVTTIAGEAGVTGSTDGIGKNARFSGLSGITTDGVNLYICEGGNKTIRKLVIETGEVTTIAGQVGLSDSIDGIGNIARFYNPSGITTDGKYLYVADKFNGIRKIELSNYLVTTITDDLHYVSGITYDGNSLYCTDSRYATINRVEISTGQVTTIAGNGSGNEDGTGVDARFYIPNDLVTDGKKLYIVDRFNYAIRVIE